MSISITRSPQLVQYFGSTKNIVDVTNYTNLKTIFRISNEGGYEAWDRANEGTTFNAFDQLENGAGYLIISEDSAPTSYDLDSGESVSPPASTSVEAGIAIKQYQSSFDLSSSDAFRDNLNQLFIVNADGGYESWAKSNEDTNFNGFNTLDSGETYLIFSDSSLTFPADNYAWATFTPGNKMYAVDPKNDKILIVDTASHATVGSIDCLRTPSKIIVDSSKSLAYVLTYNSQVLQVLDLLTETFVDEIRLYHSNAPYNVTFHLSPTDMELYDDGTDQFLSISSVTSGSSIIVNLTTRSVESEIEILESGFVTNNLIVADPDDSSSKNLYVCDALQGKISRYENKNLYKHISSLESNFSGDGLGRVVSMSPNGQYLAVSRREREFNVYKMSSDRWQKIGSVFIDSTDFDYIQSLYVNDSGKVAVGIIQVGNTSLVDYGAVLVYDLNTSTKKYVPASPMLKQDTVTLDAYGHAVAISEDGLNVFVSAPKFGGVGAVFAYSYDVGSSSWSEKGNPIRGSIDFSINNGMFGDSISISSNGNRILVGCVGKNESFLFEYVSNDWEQIAPPIKSVNDIGFGKHVQIDAGGSIALCVSDNLARVFSLDGGTAWQLRANEVRLASGDVVRMSSDANTIVVVNSMTSRIDILKYNSYNSKYALSETLYLPLVTSDNLGSDIAISNDGLCFSTGASRYNQGSGLVMTYKKQ